MTPEMREHLQEVVAWLEGDRRIENAKFDMDEVLEVDDTGCGSVCCIAGALALLNTDWKKVFRSPSMQNVGVDWENMSEQLGDVDTAHMLFDPGNAGYQSVRGWPNFNNQITPAWAARTIRHLLDTGRVEWNVTRETEREDA